jgi:hypothetical protein
VCVCVCVCVFVCVAVCYVRLTEDEDADSGRRKARYRAPVSYYAPDDVAAASSWSNEEEQPTPVHTRKQSNGGGARPSMLADDCARLTGLALLTVTREDLRSKCGNCSRSSYSMLHERTVLGRALGAEASVYMASLGAWPVNKHMRLEGSSGGLLPWKQMKVVARPAVGDVVAVFFHLRGNVNSLSFLGVAVVKVDPLFDEFRAITEIFSR